MPEIDDAHKTEYDRKTQGQQNPEGALHQTQEQVLDELRKFNTSGCQNTLLENGEVARVQCLG